MLLRLRICNLRLLHLDWCRCGGYTTKPTSSTTAAAFLLNAELDLADLFRCQGSRFLAMIFGSQKDKFLSICARMDWEESRSIGIMERLTTKLICGGRGQERCRRSDPLPSHCLRWLLLLLLAVVVLVRRNRIFIGIVASRGRRRRRSCPYIP